MDPLTLINSDCLAALKTLPAESVQCCVTSPPYFGLRDYGHAGQIGLEATPADYVAKMVEVFAEVRRVLKPDGTLWLNLGDSYAGSWGAQSREHAGKHAPNVSAMSANQVKAAQIRASGTGSLGRTPGLKPKDLMGIPWRVAFALQADGWYLRSACPWVKRNCMPESVTDRPTSGVEYVFIFSKAESYFYDHDAVKMPVAPGSVERLSQDIENQVGTERANGGAKTNGNFKAVCGRAGKNSFRGQGHMREGAGPANREGRDMKDVGAALARNRRNSDWFWESWQGLAHDEEGEPLAFVVNPQPYRDAHFATWPRLLVQPMILAGSRPGDVVLEPFAGSGTTGMVAIELGRRAVLIELNPEYCALIRQRCAVTPGLALSA